MPRYYLATLRWGEEQEPFLIEAVSREAATERLAAFLWKTTRRTLVTVEHEGPEEFVGTVLLEEA